MGLRPRGWAALLCCWPLLQRLWAQVPPCSGNIDAQVAYLVYQRGLGPSLVQTQLLIDRCLEETPLVSLLFNTTPEKLGTGGWRGLLARYTRRWRTWRSEGGRSLQEESEPVIGLETFRLVFFALRDSAQGLFELAVRHATAQLCHRPLSAAAVEGELDRLARRQEMRVSAALRLLPGAPWPASVRDYAPSAQQLVPAPLGSPLSIVRRHAAVDLLSSVQAYRKERAHPERSFEALYEVARKAAEANCLFQAHMSAYLHVAMVEAAEACLLDSGTVPAEVLLSDRVGPFHEEFDGLLAEDGPCPPLKPIAGASFVREGGPRLPTPEYRFEPLCCRRQHVLEHLLSELGADVPDGPMLSIVEVGVRLATTSWELLARFPRLRVLAVDPYEGNDGLAAFVAGRLAAFGEQRARLLRLPSADAARNVTGPFDLVFVDGNHNFDHVVEDISLWQPLVRPGGILAGHDIFNPVCDVHVALRHLRRVLGEDGVVRGATLHVSADNVFYWHV